MIRHLAAAGAFALAAACRADVALGGNVEPAIAINPTNPRNIVVVTGLVLFYSNDAGSTWASGTSVPLPAGYGACGNSSLAFDGEGRLFWCYLALRTGKGECDVVVTPISPANGAAAGAPVLVTNPATSSGNDKPWIAADANLTSPFAGRIYVSWARLGADQSWRILSSASSDHGEHWSAPLQLSEPGESFPWPPHNAVARTGEVYVAYHSQPGFNGVGEDGGNPDGVSGRVYVVRSTNGGASFPHKSLAFGAGRADTTFNVQSSPGAIRGTRFWTLGTAQAWVLPDPVRHGSVYVVASDDPDNNHAVGDAVNVYLARSIDHGETWDPPARVDHGPGASFQVMPCAAIDPATGFIAVSWYDNRRTVINGHGHFLLDVYCSGSTDGGRTFSPDFRLSSDPVDPDLGYLLRYPGPPPTYRIGDYNGIAVGGGQISGAWAGTGPSALQIIYGRMPTAGVCFANCDGSTTPPRLNIEDYLCFLAKFAAGDPSANCDGNQHQPMLSVNDLICFQSHFAAGCP
jgi:hypothetical protein